MQRLPPLSTEPNRCERAFIGNTIGQANGVYDKPLDLRQCDFTNEKSNLKGKSLSAALMSDAKFDGADMSEVIMSKAYAAGASFKGNIFHLCKINLTLEIKYKFFNVSIFLKCLLSLNGRRYKTIRIIHLSHNCRQRASCDSFYLARRQSNE